MVYSKTDVLLIAACSTIGGIGMGIGVTHLTYYRMLGQSLRRALEGLDNLVTRFSNGMSNTSESSLLKVILKETLVSLGDESIANSFVKTWNEKAPEDSKINFSERE